MTDPATIALSILASKAVKEIATESLVEKIWDGVVDFVADQAKGFAKKTKGSRLHS